MKSMLVSVLLFARLAWSAEGASNPHLAKAQTLYNEGDFARAGEEFEAAQAASKDPKLFLNIGQSYERSGDIKKALKAYSKYLSEFPAAENTGDVNRSVAELTAQTYKDAKPPKVDKLPPRIRHEPKEAWPAGEAITIEVTIEDLGGVFEPMLMYRAGGAGAFVPSPLQPSGKDKFVGLVSAMEVGDLDYFVEAYDTKGNGPSRHGTPTYPHRIRVAAPGSVPAQAAASVAPALPGVDAPQMDIVATEEPTGRGPWAYVTLGVGAAAALAGAYFGIQARSAGARWAGAIDKAAWQTARDDAQGAALNATVSWVAAGALVAGGGALFVFTNF